MAKPVVYWINTDTKHAWYIKYGLMKCAIKGKCIFRKVPLKQCTEFGLPKDIHKEMRRCHAVFIVEHEGRRKTVVTDFAEGYIFLSPIIEISDLYFCSAFNSDLFRKHVFLRPYPWQEREYLAPYKRGFRNIENKYGPFFHRLRPFIPIPLSLYIPKAEMLRSGVWGVLHRMNNLAGDLPFLGILDPEYRKYDLRYRQAKRYRGLPPAYDVVLRDALWGWPMHRIALHLHLEQLSRRHHVISSLSVPKSEDDPSWWKKQLSHEVVQEAERLVSRRMAFPANYERMVASSRLGVYATGKHWGWRAIFFLHLLWGIPVIMDRPLYEPYIDLETFDVVYTGNEWEELSECLEAFDDSSFQQRKKINCETFDTYLSPTSVAWHVLSETLTSNE